MKRIDRNQVKLRIEVLEREIWILKAVILLDKLKGRFTKEDQNNFIEIARERSANMFELAIECDKKMNEFPEVVPMLVCMEEQKVPPATKTLRKWKAKVGKAKWCKKKTTDKVRITCTASRECMAGNPQISTPKGNICWRCADLIMDKLENGIVLTPREEEIVKGSKETK